MYDNTSELYQQYLEISYLNKTALSDAKKIKLGNKYGPINFYLETYNNDVWFESEESTDKNGMPPLEGDEEEVKVNCNSKQIINYTSNIIRTKKIWKQFIHIKK